MKLRDFVRESDIHLALAATTKLGTLTELIGSLALSPDQAALLLKILERRESLGSTGIGQGIAIPHCRTQLVPRLRVLYGRTSAPVEWEAADGRPVSHVFLLAAPPVEVSNDYLPVLGRIAQLMKDPDVPGRLATLETPAQFLELLETRGV